MGNNCSYISVILPLKLSWEPFYSVPEGTTVVIGDRVNVIFAGRQYLGVVSGTDVCPDECTLSRILPIRQLRTDKERILETEIEFWRKIAEYYMCSVGQVYKAAYTSVKNQDVKARPTEEKYVEGKGCTALSGESPAALQAVTKALAEGKTALLSSPDSESILAELCLRNRKGNAVWIVPELKMEKTMQQRLQEIFGSRLILWGSDMTPARKRKATDMVRSGKEPYIVFGTRSALFLPHHDLGLVIVGDEHDPSYKQNSPSPRYNGRDAAILLASIFRAGCVLESVTPSLESLYNCLCGKFTHIRCVEAKRPRFDIVDTNAELRKNGMCGDVSRRFIACTPSDTAAYKPLKAAFPKFEDLKARIAESMGEDVFLTDDLISNPIPQGRRNLGVFGVDAMLGKADFRADERLFQTIWRAVATGPSSIENVLIHTREAGHPVFKALQAGDITPLMEERKAFNMPPFTRIVDIRIVDKFDDRARRMGGKLASIAEKVAGRGKVMQGEGGIRILLNRDSTLKQKKRKLIELVYAFEIENKYPDHLYFDVDPV
ncbi:MAG: hypothetical protein MJY49_05355 [Bacteroidales bacterium]|nr:hypothetical protein [Bacteroidales bacterium]